MTTNKKILVVKRQPPYYGTSARESIDAVLVSAAYDQAISVVFTDDGVFQLLPHQKPSVGTNNIQKALDGLELYDITHIYAVSEALSARNIDPESLNISLKLISREEYANLLNHQDVVLSF